MTNDQLIPKKIVVLISGSGSNLQALIDSINDGYINGRIVLVISNKSDAYGLERAKNARVGTKAISSEDFSNRNNYDEELVRIINQKDPDLVVLAGYMRICSKRFVDEYYGRLINLHPSLLPAFAGVDGIGDAFDYGVKVTGVTVHFVDEGCDTGPIILQETVHIEEDDSKESLALKIHELEHRLLPKAVKLFCEDKLRLEGRKVRLL